MTYADDVAAARAEVAAANAKFKSAQSDLVTAQAAVSTAQDKLVAANDTLIQAETKLQNLLDNPPVTPPPTPSGKCLIGATVGGNDGGLNIIADARRGYDLSSNGAKEASDRCKTGGLIWVGYKGSISESGLRAQLQALVALLKTKNQTALVTYEHEPDIKGGIPLTTYHAGYDQLEKVIKEFPTLQPIVTLTGFTGDKDPSIWKAYSRPAHKWLGFDHYNKGHQLTGEPMSTPAENYGKMVAYAKSVGKPMCIGETGVGDDAKAGSVIKTQAQWYSEHRKYALDPANNIMVACAFDSGLAELNQAEAKAWFGV